MVQNEHKNRLIGSVLPSTTVRSLFPFHDLPPVLIAQSQSFWSWHNLLGGEKTKSISSSRYTFPHIIISPLHSRLEHLTSFLFVYL